MLKITSFAYTNATILYLFLLLVDMFLSNLLCVLSCQFTGFFLKCRFNITVSVYYKKCYY